MVLEPYLWFTSLLQKHVAKAGQIHGLSVPQFVLKSISKGQKGSTFVSPDMKELINSIADVACVIGAVEDVSKPLSKMESKPDKIFSDQDRTYLRSLTKDLRRKVKKYNEIIHSAQKQKKKCWKLGKTAAEKMAVMDNNRNQRPYLADKHKKRFLHSYEELLKELTSFMNIVDKGEVVRTEMNEIGTSIKHLVISVIEKKTKDAIEILTDLARQNEDTRLPTKHIVDSLSEINPNRMANEIFSGTAEMFYFPNIEDYKRYPEFMLSIPGSNLNKKVDNPVIVTKRTMACQMVATDYRHISSTNEEMLPGFFQGQKDLKVQLKLELLEGKVGFGYAKKSIFSARKTWEFLYLI